MAAFAPKYLTAEEARTAFNRYLAQLELGRLQAEMTKVADTAYDTHEAPERHPEKFSQAIEAVERLWLAIYPPVAEGGS